MKSRCFRVSFAVFFATCFFLIIGCTGSRSYFANRPVPPSDILQRVLVSVQNPGGTSNGILQILDARYDIRASLNGKVPRYLIGSYSGNIPTFILNYPEQTSGYVYNSGDGSITPINYSTEQAGGVISNLPGFSSSVFISSDGNYSYIASQADQYLTVRDGVKNIQVALNLPNVYKVAANPSGTVALAFVQNSNYAYRVIRLEQPNGTIMSPPVFHPTNGPWPAAVSPVDCQPVNLPTYCVVPVLDQNDNPIAFDRPYNAIFSSDGTTAWLLNCGPECGNTAADPVTGQPTASVSFLNPGPLNVYNFPGSTYPSTPVSPAPPTELQRISVPGGATMALYGNNMLYVSGQQQQSDGLFEGFLSILNLNSNQVTASYPISDGLHTKMLFGDDNTLWIGSQLCQTGYHTANNIIDPTTKQPANGCLTLFNMNNVGTSNPAILIEPWYGDLTGLCAITQWHKMYTAQGGQIHLYATTDQGITTNQNRSATGYMAGTELSNYDVTVTGTAYDVAYMDALSNAAD